MKHLEFNEQANFIKWCRLASKTMPELLAFKYLKTNKITKKTSLEFELNVFSNNNTQSLNKNQALRHKMSGSGSGIPDIFIPIAKGGFHGLYLEFKAPDEKPKTDKGRGGLSEVQMLRIAALKKNLYAVEVVYSWIEAKNILLKYLGA